MNAAQIISELESGGIRLWEEAGELRFRAPKGVLTEERRAVLRANKEAVIEALRAQAGATVLVAQPEARHEPFPLTDLQSAYLFGRHSAYGFGGVSCHMYVELNFEDLQPARLEHAWNRLIARHDMLRAVVAEDGSQRVLPEVSTYRIAVGDLRGTGAERTDGVIAGVRAEMGHRLRNPDQWPLFELRVTQSDTRSILHLSIDFIIADWASIRLLMAELDSSTTDAPASFSRSTSRFATTSWRSVDCERAVGTTAIAAIGTGASTGCRAPRTCRWSTRPSPRARPGSVAGA